jgi:hypothetical protein
MLHSYGKANLYTPRRASALILEVIADSRPDYRSGDGMTSKQLVRQDVGIYLRRDCAICTRSFLKRVGLFDLPHEELGNRRSGQSDKVQQGYFGKFRESTFSKHHVDPPQTHEWKGRFVTS